VPGSARWLKERNEALEAERLALVKQTLEVQVFLKSVKQKVNTAIDISDRLEGDDAGDDDAVWAVESAQMLEEKEELVSRLIVHSQQGRQPFYSSLIC